MEHLQSTVNNEVKHLAFSDVLLEKNIKIKWCFDTLEWTNPTRVYSKWKVYWKVYYMDVHDTHAYLPATLVANDFKNFTTLKVTNLIIHRGIIFS